MILPDKLRHTILMTSRSRFEASRRLMGHFRVSQWVISIISATLIVLPQILDSLSGQNEVKSYLQSGLAIVLLVYSIILSSENFYFRSREHFRCGLELEKLIGEIDTCSSVSVAHFDKEYRRILDGFENHETLDYERAWYNLNKWDRSKFSYWQRFRMALLTRSKIVVGYLYYVPFIIFIVILFIFSTKR